MYVGTDYSQQDGFISHPYLILYRHCFADAYQIGRLPSADLQTTQYPRVQLPAHLQECRDEVWVVHSLCKEPGNREVHSCFTNCNQTVQQCLPRQVPHSKYSPIHHFVTECESAQILRQCARYTCELLWVFSQDMSLSQGAAQIGKSRCSQPCMLIVSHLYHMKGD